MNPEAETNENVEENVDASQTELPPADSTGEDHEAKEATQSQEEPLTPEQHIAVLQAEVAEWKDRALRRQAEAENVKKKAFKEKMEVRKYAMRGFVEDLLRVADTFKLALGSNTEDQETFSESHKTLLSGIDMTFKELLQVFERHGVKEINAEPGAVFDPSLHEAIGRVPSEQPVDTIVEVARAGWKMGDYVLRGAMVAVSTGPTNDDTEDTENAAEGMTFSKSESVTDAPDENS